MILRIREVIKEKGMTTEDVAKKLDISVSSLNQSISGNPRIETLIRIADALNVPITELFEERVSSTITCPHCGRKIRLKIEP